MLELHLPAPIASDLERSLRWHGVEEVAFIFAAPQEVPSVLRALEIFRVPREGFRHQSDVHVSLTDETRAYVIARAWQLGGALIEAHSHRDDPPVFSASDILGFADWVPHVRWRLRGRPYVALVFAPGGFDALVWDAPTGKPTGLARLTVDGQPARAPSGLTLRSLCGGWSR